MYKSTFTTADLTATSLTYQPQVLQKVSVAMTPRILKALESYLKVLSQVEEAIKALSEMDATLGVYNQTDKSYAIRYNEKYKAKASKVETAEKNLVEKEKAVKLQIMRAAKAEGQFAGISKELIEKGLLPQKKAKVALV